MIVFMVSGNPVPKARARTARGHAFTPKRTVEWEAKVRDAARLCVFSLAAAGTPYGWFNDTVQVQINIFSATKRRQDGDNIEKSVLDAAIGVLWADDSQVVDCHWTKRVDRNTPRVEVMVWKHGGWGSMFVAALRDARGLLPFENEAPDAE